MDLPDIKDRILALPALEKRRVLMREEINKAEREVAELRRKHESGSQGLERLQSESFSNFLLRLMGRYDNKLEKEQRKEINAKIDYDRAVTHLEHLQSETRELTGRINDLKREETAYQKELDRRRQALSAKLTQPEGARYAALTAARENIISQQTDMEETLKIVGRAKSTAAQVSKSLRSAKGWATFDAVTRGGLITHAAKYSHIDKAESLFNTLSHHLRELRSELHGTVWLTEISSGQRFVDFWFDNIFTNLSVRQKIAGNETKIRELHQHLTRLEKELEIRIQGKARDYEENRQQEEALLLGM